MVWTYGTILLLFPLFLFAALSEEEVLSRIEAHLLIGDAFSALQEWESAHLPESGAMRRAHIRALVASQKVDEAISIWESSDQLDDLDLLEILAWGILERSRGSSQYAVSLSAILGAASTRDARALFILLDQFTSPHPFLRALAAHLSAEYGDDLLVRGLLRLLDEERVAFVRMEVVRALGKMRVKESRGALERILTSQEVDPEEKAAVIEALLQISDGIGEGEFFEIAHSERAGLRRVACEVVEHLDLGEYLFEVERLLEDPCPDVRIAALRALSLVGLEEFDAPRLDKMQHLIDDCDAVVSVVAAWAVARYFPEKGIDALREKIDSTDRRRVFDTTPRYLAAFLLGRVGGEGVAVARTLLEVEGDPFIRVNLALGMIGEEGERERICDILYSFFMDRCHRVMWDLGTHSLFPIIVPSRVRHVEGVPHYPMEVDQLTRLDLLNHLALLDDVRVEEALKDFLHHRVLGISFFASMLLLEEGGERGDGVWDALWALFEGETGDLRVQAAIVLALFGGGSDAMYALHNAYGEASWEMRIAILHAIGYAGGRESVPFLRTLLGEPHRVVQVAVASALIRSLYH